MSEIRVAVLAAALAVASPRPARAQLPVPSAPKAAVACQRALATAAAKSVAGQLKSLEGCAAAVFKCIQLKPDDPKCLPKAAAACDPKAAAAIAKREEQLVAKILTNCAGDKLPFDDLSDPGILGFDAVGAQCSDVLGLAPGAEIADAVDVAACVAFTHTDQAQTLYGVARPRARELVELAGVADDVFPVLPFYGGKGAFILDSDTAAKAVVKCAAKTAKAAAKFAQDAGAGLAKCITVIASCIAKAPDKQADCLAKAGGKCGQIPDRIVKARAKLTGTVTGTCDGAVPFAGARGPNALNVDVLECECEDVGVSSLDTVGDYAQCLVRQHECRLAEVAKIAAPRLDDLLALVSLDVEDLLCPPIARAAGPALAIGAGSSVSDYVARLLRLTGQVAGQLRAGPPPAGFGANGPATITSITRSGGRRPAVRAGIQQFRLRYRDPATLSTVVKVVKPAATLPPTLLLVIRRADGSFVDGFFEVPLSAVDGIDDIEIEFPDTLAPCGFDIAFATRDEGGNVGAVAPVDIVPDALPECGNNVVEPGEVCEPGLASCPGALVCTLSCSACVPASSCTERCCLGRDDTCKPVGAQCYCDEFCRIIGDCCADVGDQCGF